jgi:predicted transcriptional regulator
MLVLYMLKRCESPLSKAQIYDFILEKEYTNYMTLQEAFGELASSELIVEKTMGNRTYLEITEEGSQTLEFFGNRINPSIRQDIDSYLKDNSMKLRNESSVLGDYRKIGENEYEVSLLVREGGRQQLGIKLVVPVEEMAQAMLDNWQKKSEDIYSYLYSKLM